MIHEAISWHVVWQVDKYRVGESDPYETLIIDGNLLVDSGIQFMLDRLVGTSGTSFSNANARIGVGDSAVEAAAGQTDLLGTNKTRKGMDSTFPSRSGNVLTFKATFGSGDANFEWREAAIFNAASGGTMLNRKSGVFGDKTSSDEWEVTATVTLN